MHPRPGDGRSRSRQLARQPRCTPTRRHAADVARTRRSRRPAEAPDLALLRGRGRSIPVITNPGVASRRPAPAEVFGVVGTLLSTSLDAGVPLHDVQEAASHADPRTTMRYDRARGSLDRHATYIVAGAAR